MMRPSIRARGILISTAVGCLCSLWGICCGTIPIDEHASQKINLLENVEERDLAPLPSEYEATHRIEITTSMGIFEIELYGKEAPETVANFLKYMEQGFYHDKIFHRVIPDFMIQGGGFDSEMVYGRTDVPVDLEIIPGLRHEPGVVSMARTNDPDSATSQFFVCVGAAPQLNGTYAAFGRVVKGMEVVEAISNVTTKTVETEFRSMADVPVNPVFLEQVKLL